MAIVLFSAAYCTFFLVMLVVAYTGHLPVSEISKIHNFDKFGHLILYSGDMLCSLIGIGAGYWLAQRQIRRIAKATR